MTYIMLLEHGKNDRIAVYIPKETILKEINKSKQKTNPVA
jgi:hypothetical protein